VKTLSIPALTILSRVTVKGTLAFLPPEQLDRALYDEVNSALESFGGKWNRKAQAHVFRESPVDLLDDVVQTGSYVKQKTEAQRLGFFETPPELAKRLVAAAGIKAGATVLEPSAGTGNLVRAIPDWAGWAYACEINPAHFDPLRTATARWGTAASTVCCPADFLQLRPSDLRAPLDVVVMNPPFAKGADIDHVLHALTFLRPGGRLAAIMPASILYRGNAKAVTFRELVQGKGGSFEALPDGSFLASGTATRTVMLQVTA
jgi:predicted RNA methylase